MTDTPIHLQGVYKSFGSNRVLAGIDLDLNPEESFVLLGRSGSGKSVLLKALLGLIPIDRGRIEMEGQSILGESRAQKYARMDKIGMVFQGSALFDSLPVWENVAFGVLMTRHISRQQAHKLALEKLELVGLGPSIADLLPAELSGGMQRRVALACAIAFEPRFLFLDEPTAGLDPVFSRLIGELIQTCRRTLRSITFTITHDLHLARNIADRVGMLHEGEIIWQGAASALPFVSHPVVKEFMGNEGAQHAPSQT